MRNIQYQFKQINKHLISTQSEKKHEENYIKIKDEINTQNQLCGL